MKTKILLLTMFAANLLFAQKTEKCATMTQYHKHVANNPQLIEKRKEIETFTQNWIRSQNSQKRGTRNVVTIPVVVHVIHAGEPIGTGTNISDAQIYSQIDILNEDFRLLNADSLDSNHPFWVDAADSEIEFCLAQQDEDGFATNGINRVDGLAEFGYDSWWNQEEVDTLVKPATQWDPLSYLNIWVVAFDPNGDAADLLGYANFPDEHGFDHDGVVITLAEPPHMKSGIILIFAIFGAIQFAEMILLPILPHKNLKREIPVAQLFLTTLLIPAAAMQTVKCI
jgi:hypothetical protein